MNAPRVHILLVEDDAVDRIACRRALASGQGCPYEISEAETAREGLQQVRAQAPDLIVLDYNLPDMHGVEFLAELAADTGEVRVPVVMLTGAGDVAIAVDAMRRGARDFLIKDGQGDHLRLLPTVIERVLREARVVAEKREAEAKYRCLIEQIPAIAYTAALEEPGRLIYVSPQIARLGYTPEEWCASPDGVLNRIHPDDQARVLDAFARSYESGEPLRCEYRLLTRSGEVRWFLDEARLVTDAEGLPVCLQGVLIDITEDKKREQELDYHRRRLEELVAQRTAQIERQATLLRDANASLLREIEERRQAEAALRASEGRFRLLLESAGEGIYGLDTEGRCIFINAAAQQMLGYTQAEVLGRQTHPLLHPVHADGTPYPQDQCRLYDALRKGEAVRGVVEVAWRKDGTSFPAEYSAHPLREAGRITGAVLVFRDVTEAQALAHRLSFQATHDALTGLVNRQEFERRLERVLAETRGDGEDYALLYLDLDQFKVVNDTCGHTAGDQLLRQVTARLHECLRARDTLARLGGDEFGVLLEHCPLDQALRIATDLRDAVQNYRFVWEGKPFSVGVSIGLVPLSATVGNANAALAAADAACYAAKEQGRNRVHLYQPDDALLAHQQAQMQWVSRLTHALDAGRFRLYQQVIAPLASKGQGRVHVEVLLRLVEEDGRIVEPMAFVPAAERYNLMPAIDRWVIREVIGRHAAPYRERPANERPIFAINLSGSSLSDERLADFVNGLLTEYRVPADMLCFEITETAAVTQLNRATELIRALKREGCLFALDDFGSGMSSFAYLKQLPVDFLKIDGSFIRSMLDDRVTRAMAEAINRVAHVMAIETVAECAESAPLVALLKDLGVDHAQGYALDRPQPMTAPGTAAQPAEGRSDDIGGAYNSGSTGTCP